MAVSGATVQGKRWQLVHKTAHEMADGPVPATLRGMIHDPVTWTSMCGAVFAVLGVVALMTTKPGWGLAVAIILALYVVGALVGRALATRGSQVHQARAAG
jgi:hypothetical protein